MHIDSDTSTIDDLIEFADKLFVGIDNAKIILLDGVPFRIINNTASLEPKSVKDIFNAFISLDSLIVGGISDSGSVAFIKLYKNGETEVIYGEEGDYLGIIALEGKVRKRISRAQFSYTIPREYKPLILIPRDMGYDMLFMGSATIKSTGTLFKITSSLLRPLINKFVVVKLYDIISYVKRTKKNLLGFLRDLIENEEVVRPDLVMEKPVKVRRVFTRYSGEEYENGCIEVYGKLNKDDTYALLIYLPFDVRRLITNGDVRVNRRVYILEWSVDRRVLYLVRFKGSALISKARTSRKQVNVPSINEALNHVIKKITFYGVPVQKTGTVYLVRKDLNEYIGYYAIVEVDGEMFVKPITEYKTGNYRYGKIVFSLKTDRRRVDVHVYITDIKYMNV